MSEPDPIRVLWLIKGLGPGGAEHLLVHHARARDREAFTYEAAYLVPVKRHLVPDLERAGIEVMPLDAPREWDPRWARRLRRRLVSDPVDVIHVHSPYVAAVTRLIVRSLPRQVRPALLYTEHNRWPRHHRVTRLANRLTIALDDADLAVSASVRATMPGRLPVEVLEHGIDLDATRLALADRDTARVELGIGPDEVVIGIVANLRREKGYDVLLDAAHHTLAGRDDVRFVAVGQGPLAAELRERHDELGLGDRFLLLGYREDAIRVMAAFDVFTLASRHEGLPVALMEALALGLPVVATAAGGIPEMVTDGVEALLVPVDDADALAAAYGQLIDDPALRARMGEAAAHRGEAFAIDRSVHILEARYRELAADRRT